LASVTDIRERRIPNIVSWGLLYFGMAAQTLFWVRGVVPFSYVIAAVLGGGVFAYLAYRSGMAAAGDAKLFWAASVALPRGFLFPPLVLAINTFIPYLAGLVLLSLVRSRPRAIARAARQALSPASVLQSVVGVMGFVGIGMALSAGVETAAKAWSDDRAGGSVPHRHIGVSRGVMDA
jgi:Flp pilus assembly protein protease CpaA